MPAQYPAATATNGKRFRRIAYLQQKYGGVTRQTIWRWCRDGILPKPRYMGSIPLWDEDLLDDAPKSRG